MKNRLNEKSDIYSFGIVMRELGTEPEFHLEGGMTEIESRY